MLEGRRSGVRWAPVLGLVVVVMAIGAGAAWSATRPASGRYLYPLPAAPAWPAPCPPPPTPPTPPAPPLGPPAVPEHAIPLVGGPPTRHVDLSAVSGKGIWLTVWPGSPLDVTAVIALAHAARLHQLWVRTGSTTNGYYGDPILRALVPAAHAAGIAVIAWDFPTLSDPARDARRAAAALRAGADGFGADIETSAEGTYLTARRVAYYLSLVRAAAHEQPVVAIVPRPTPYWLTAYPYRAEAPFVDAFAPMVYWSCTEPGAAVGSAIARPRVATTRRTHRTGLQHGLRGRPPRPSLKPRDLALPRRRPSLRRHRRKPLRPRGRRPAPARRARRLPLAGITQSTDCAARRDALVRPGLAAKKKCDVGATTLRFFTAAGAWVVCPECHAEVTEGAKFCMECGTALALRCRACGTAYSLGQRFCAECGAALNVAAADVQSIAAPGAGAEQLEPGNAELRLVSVLFVDLVGFTSLSESRDAEDVRELLGRYFDSARTIVDRYGGMIEKFIGDAVMAVWGVPVAREDDAERAVRAALEVVDAVAVVRRGGRARRSCARGRAW